MSLDVLAKGVSRVVVDSLVGEHAPAVVRGKVFREAVRGVDFLRREPIKSLADTGLWVDYMSKAALKGLLDSLVWLDRVSKSVGKLFEFETTVLDIPTRTARLHVTVAEVARVLDLAFRVAAFLRVFREFVIVRDAPFRVITVTLRDFLVGESLAAKEYVTTKVEVGLVSDFVRRELGKRAIEVVTVTDRILRGIEKRLVELTHVRDVLARAVDKVLEDRMKMAEIEAKVAYTLAGFTVRRVYFLPPEFRALWDIISSQDHNVKTMVCQSLLEAFKRVKDKLGA